MSALAAVLDRLPPAAKIALHARLLAARRQREAGRRWELLYPEQGPLRRELYAKSMQFYAAGKTHLERGLLGANRVGKTTTAGYEIVAHLCGIYKPWWAGRRFDRPITAWCAGDDAKSVREVQQSILLGPPGSLGEGLIPRDAIIGTSRRQGVSDAIDSALVRHASGGTSRLVFKSFDQQREAFQGAKVDCVWLDEEPPESIYTEALTRLLSTEPGEPSGTMLCTFTPLRGISSVVLRFLPEARLVEGHSRFAVIVSHDDVPHIPPEERRRMEESYAPHEREARTQGRPSLGSGAVFPVPETTLVCEPFEVKPWMRRCYGLDVGFKVTAACFLAHDYESDVVYVYDEYRGEHQEPSVHAHGLRARAHSWIPGVIDPASRGRSQVDGQQLITIYRDLGLTLTPANNAVESGLLEMWERMSSGRLKVFNTCRHLISEIRIYRRDEQGRIIKEADHNVDALRYAVMSGLKIAASKPSRLWTERDLPRGVQSRGHESNYDPLSFGVAEQSYGDRFGDKYGSR